MKKNVLFAIIGPSGAGKGTAIKEIKKLFPNLKYPTSYTTRSKRENEVDGEVYHFISQEKFENMISNHEFLEYQRVHNNAYYGSSKQEILGSLENQSVLREFDIQGVKAIQETLEKDQLIKIFITVDDWSILEARILKRSYINQAELQQRKESFQKELIFAKECDYVLTSHENQQIELINQLSQIINKHL